MLHLGILVNTHTVNFHERIKASERERQAQLYEINHLYTLVHQLKQELGQAASIVKESENR